MSTKSMGNYVAGRRQVIALAERLDQIVVDPTEPIYGPDRALRLASTLIEGIATIDGLDPDTFADVVTAMARKANTYIPRWARHDPLLHGGFESVVRVGLGEAIA